MNESERTVQMFREQARQDGTEFIALSQDGYIMLCGFPPTGPACRGYAPAESEEAAELVRSAVEEFGIHYLTEAELAGREAELNEEMHRLRSGTRSEQAVRQLAEQHLSRKHTVLHCTFPAPGGGQFDAWLNEGGSWETGHPAITTDALCRAVRAFLDALECD